MLTCRPPGFAGRVFPYIVDRLLDSHFHRIVLEPSGPVPAGPLLVLANHVGWWDAFLVHRLNREVLRRRYHVMMLEEELSKRPFFRRVGAFSWRREDRAESKAGVAYAGSLLSQPDAMVLVFPQGEIRSQYTTDPHFGSAPKWLMQAAGRDVSVVFVSLLFDYGSNAKPTATVRWSLDAGAPGRGERFAAFQAACRAEQARA